MSLFDTLGGLATQFMSNQAGNQEQSLAAVAELLGAQQGGLAGLVQQFQQQGLGDLVASWVGSGQNQAISAEQIQQVLGGTQLAEFAGKLGLASTSSASGALADLLPKLIDAMTPDGKLPDADPFQQGMSALMGLLQR
jgi:uncharacterized protein YidB (DUF937 family)